MLVFNYQSSLLNIPEERRSQILRPSSSEACRKMYVASKVWHKTISFHPKTYFIISEYLRFYLIECRYACLFSFGESVDVKVGLRCFGGSSCPHYHRQSVRGEELCYTGRVIQIWRRNRRWYFRQNHAQVDEKATGNRYFHNVALSPQGSSLSYIIEGLC
jgi:hypothetical protein